jgi:hypothetical protein
VEVVLVKDGAPGSVTREVGGYRGCEILFNGSTSAGIDDRLEHGSGPHDLVCDIPGDGSPEDPGGGSHGEVGSDDVVES